MATEFLDELFNCAASFVQIQATAEDGKKLDQPQLLELYGLYKSAILGPCSEPKPGIFNPKGRAKWEAWKQVSYMKKEEAQQGYVNKVKELYDWVPPDLADISEMVKKKIKESSGSLGVSVSTMSKPKEEDDDGKDPKVFTWAKENDIAKIISWIIEGHDINKKDSEGISLLHWGADRGHYDTCKVLLSNGANPDIVDKDGQTPLDYAVTCEHEAIVDLLQEYSQ